MRLVAPDPDQRFDSAAGALEALRRPKQATAPVAAMGPGWMVPAIPPAGLSYRPLAPSGGSSALAVRGPTAMAPPAPRPPTNALRPILAPSRTIHAGPTDLPLLLLGSMGLFAGIMMAAMSPVMMLMMPMFAVLAGLRLNAQRAQSRILRARALYQNGATTVGQLTWGWFNPGSTSLRYRYEAQGGVFDGYLETADLARSRRLRYRDPVHVFYDPSDPSVHVALLDYEMAQLQTPAA
jgi:hypothetical protein